MEIVYWGCNTVLNATAPALVLRNLHQSRNSTRDYKKCNCTDFSTFPGLDDPQEEPLWQYDDNDANNNITTDGDTQQVPTAQASMCGVVVGRPFRDQEGVSIVSTTSESAFSNSKQAGWSKASRTLLNRYNSVPPKMVTQDETMARDWTSRALGEHASVASFSAFSIALMSNGAPPDLIQDSLIAAQDELRHAQISFHVASQLSGSDIDIEPSALPSSRHAFGSDLMALATGVINEGCIDETLSALRLAASVDANKNKGEDEWMWNITRQIALEEGRHSILAWRTVQWICGEDAAVCVNLQMELLGKERLRAAGGMHSSNSAVVYQAWQCLAGPLACHVTNGRNCQVHACATTRPLVQQLVVQIMEGVMQTDGQKKMTIGDQFGLPSLD